MPTNTPLEPALERRRRRRRGRAATAAWLFVLSVVIGTATGALQSDAFRVREVRVNAATKGLSAAVARRLHVRPGSRLLTLDVWDLARQAERHPWVRKATVTRRLPDRLQVEVEARRAFVALRQKVQFMLVDAEGHLLSATKEPPAAMLRIRGIDLGRLRPGEQLTGRRWDVARQCAQLLARHGWRGGSLDVAAPERVRLVAPDGVVALLGPAEQCERTLPLFLQVQAYLDRTGRRAAYVDLQVPELPTWCPRAGSSPAGRSAAAPNGTSAAAAPRAPTPAPVRQP